MEKRVVVVDDEPIVVELLSETLTRGGYRVETASDGQAAMDLARTFRPHLMVLDVMMPKANGYRVSRLVKSQEGAPRVLLITGRRLDDDPDREADFLQYALADGIVYKPFELRALLARVEALIG